MTYFRMDFSSYMDASKTVWAIEDGMGWKRTSFHVSASGFDSSVWTESVAGEALLRAVLLRMHIAFEEGNKQQVITWLDEL